MIINLMRSLGEYAGRLVIALIVLIPFIWVVTNKFTSSLTILVGTILIIISASFCKDIYNFFVPLLGQILALFFSYIVISTVPNILALRLFLTALPIGIVIVSLFGGEDYETWLLTARNFLCSKTFRYGILLILIILFTYYIHYIHGFIGNENANFVNAFTIFVDAFTISLSLLLGYLSGCALGIILLYKGFKSFLQTAPYLKRIALPVIGFSVGHFCIMIWFAFIFGTIWLFNHNSFSSEPGMHPSIWNFLYLSMGSILPESVPPVDIHPVSLLARTCASIETFVGTLWMIAVFAGIIEYARKDLAKA